MEYNLKDSVTSSSFLLGDIEPHKALLNQPNDEQLLYKIMSVENFLKSVSEKYLYFNRVDRYKDFPDVDKNDSEQLPLDRSINQKAVFESNPRLTAENYYDRCRKQIYACCFSIEDSKCLWKKYGEGEGKGKICLIFQFKKLREILNHTHQLSIENKTLQLNGELLCQIFSLNYGLVDYIEKSEIQINQPRAISYAYLKDKKWKDEKEVRISLSTLGFNYCIHEKGIKFPDGLHFSFDFQSAFRDDTIVKAIGAGTDKGLVEVIIPFK
jgi:hypothetical protein